MIMAIDCTILLLPEWRTLPREIGTVFQSDEIGKQFLEKVCVLVRFSIERGRKSRNISQCYSHRFRPSAVRLHFSSQVPRG